MEQLKVCFVGVGSIAKRHIRNLRAVCDSRKIILTIDACRRSPCRTDGVDKVYCSSDAVPDDYDAVFITNPTEFHLSALEQFHGKGKHFFIEKPVVSLLQIKTAKKFETRSNSIYHVACPLRYNAVIQYIKNNIDAKDVISVRSISSSYLPDWRPGQDYRETYSAHKDMGGGVSIDLIHEWDYLTYLFGMPQRINSMIGRKSSLEIDSDDYAIYIAEYENMIAELHLDYFGRKTIREVQMFTKDDTIVGDLVNNKIEYLNSGLTIDFKEERDDYQKRELLDFIDMILGNTTAEDEYRHALRVLEFTQGKNNKE